MRISSPWLCIPLAAALASGCGRHPIALRVDPAVHIPEKRVVLFFVDGMDLPTTQKLLADGRLPNLQKHFVDGGTRVQHAVCNLPALTFPGTVSLFTGAFPSHAGILGNQWFDRRTMKWTDYITAAEYRTVNHDFHCPTIYELLQDRLTVDLFCPTSRGATAVLINQVPTDLAWAGGFYQEFDQYVAGSLDFVGPLARRAKRWPNLITFYFPGVDEIGHLAGADSAAYRAALENIDRQIGRVCAALAQERLLADTNLVLVSDHAHLPTRTMQRFDLARWIAERRGRAVHQGPLPPGEYARRYSYLDRKQAMLVDGSHRRVLVFLRGSAGWCEPPSLEQVTWFLDGNGPDDRLAAQPGVEFACCKVSADQVRVATRFGDFLVDRRHEHGQVAYRTNLAAALVPDAIESLNMQNEARLASRGWAASREWFSATAAGDHPDFIPQIAEYFDDPRAGDAVVFLARGWCTPRPHPGEHGSCLKEDMQIPLFFAGPGIPRGATLRAARLVDVLPTILDLLGEAHRAPPGLDGVSLLPELSSRHVESPAATAATGAE